MEDTFKEWLADSGYKVEAMIFRSPREWFGDQHIFRFRKDSGDWSPGYIIPWSMDTFTKAGELIGGQH